MNRRGFLKRSALIAGATAVPFVGKSQTGNKANALDDVVLNVDNNPNNWDTRTLRDH